MDAMTLLTIWQAVITHLWQTTLIMLPLFVVGWLIRSAPARLLNALWWTALLKLLVPIAVCAPWTRWLLGQLPSAVETGVSRATASAPWLAGVAAVLEPDFPSGVSGASSMVLVGLTIAWAAAAIGVLLVMHRRMLAERRVPDLPLARADADLRGQLGRLLERLAIDAASLRITSATAMPHVRGWLRPSIIIPARLVGVLEPQELEAVLLHEREHQRRRDPLRNLAMAGAVVAFFFYPLVWPLVRRLHATAEIACDEAAVRAGIAPTTCARALARSLALGLEPTCSPVTSSFSPMSLVRERLARLSDSRRYVAMLRHRVAVLTSVIFVALALLYPRLEVVGSEPAADEAAPGADAAQIAPEEDTVMPTIRKDSYVAPKYPEECRKAGIEGRVLLSILVTEKGKVVEDSTRVVEEVEDCLALTASATEAIHQWLFEPATRDGEPIDIRVMVPVQFKLDGDSEKK